MGLAHELVVGESHSSLIACLNHLFFAEPTPPPGADPVPLVLRLLRQKLDVGDKLDPDATLLAAWASVAKDLEDG